MIAAYLTAMRRYASFDGRAPRSDLWWLKLAIAVICLAALGIDGLLFGGPDGAGAPLASLVLLAHALPSLAVDVRRMHDLDRSGWFVLLGLIPLVGPLVLLAWFCRAGTPGPNRFGPDPLDGVAMSAPGASSVAAPARSTHAVATAVRDVVAEIERLARLRASGTLSEGEFEVLKAQAMAGTARA